VLCHCRYYSDNNVFSCERFHISNALVIARAQRALLCSHCCTPLTAHTPLPQQLKALWAALQADPVGVSARFGAPPAAIIAELQEEVKKMEAAEAAVARAERLKGTAPEQKVTCKLSYAAQQF
jgi:hypothetical protein